MPMHSSTNISSVLSVSLDTTKRVGSDTTYKETRVDGKDISAKLDVKLKFSFYVHGWTSKFEYDDKEWVKSEKTNFCGVDWRELASDKYDDASQEHIKKIGGQLAAFITQLHDLGVELDNISIAGHSLGAHIAGFAGRTIYERYNQLIGTIYALDPAGPGFTSLFLILDRSDYILSKADASYVQVLHTAIGTYGTSQYLGHADYYVNNGKVQKACLDDLFTFKALLFSCSHGHAKDIFLSSFSHSCAGKIEESPAEHDVYGIHTHKMKGVFKIKTTASEPYCM
ncbi:hypothetical protein HA402_013676 [Bradysia odoriphaga]|nr:hypothetical protein HA402_013676 [Bradysia odoriphaga]